MSLPDYLTVGRALTVPFVILLFVWDFPNHAIYATVTHLAVAMATDWFDGRIARRRGRTLAARLAARPDGGPSSCSRC